MHEEDQGDAHSPPSVPHVTRQGEVAADVVIPSEAMRDEKVFATNSLIEPYKSIVADLYSHNWYVQNPAILDLMKAGMPEAPGAAFIAGRAVLQAADGSAWRADRFLLDFDEWAVDASTQDQAFLAGAAYECCFDGRGAERVSFKVDYLPLIFEFLSASKWSPARQFFLSQIIHVRERFWWLPDQPLPVIRIEVAITEIGDVAVVESLTATIDDQPALSLLEDRTPPSRTRIMFDEAGLRTKIKKQTLVPPGAISFTYAPREPHDYIYLKDDKKIEFGTLVASRRPGSP
ncbi:hypothetical protein C1922_10105 [Stenotrophomonas sp. ZAC14D2_NAIMI4_7]|nr:hypothetical protein C1922_10105 [Stenotrophomonas sp. ZAC14D2_NAIMI4_7]